MDTEGWEKPSENDVTYLLEAAPQQDMNKLREDDHNVIFAIDTSGSMSSTEQVSYVTLLHRAWFVTLQCGFQVSEFSFKCSSVNLLVEDEERNWFSYNYNRL